MKIYLVRHGETDWNKKGLIQGSTDVPLNEYGRELARITADALKDIRFDRVYSSPYIRAAETAEILCNSKKINIEVDERIKEFGFGNYEGQKISVLSHAEEHKEFWKCFTSPEEYCATNGAETYPHFLSRIKSFMDEKILGLPETNDTILISAHGAVIRGFLHYVKHQSLKDLWKTHQKNCAVNIIEYSHEHFDVIEEGKLYYF